MSVPLITHEGDPEHGRTEAVFSASAPFGGRLANDDDGGYQAQALEANVDTL